MRPVLATLGLICVAAACGDGSTASTADARPASFSVTVMPNPIHEEPCGGCGPVTGQLWAVGTVMVAESAGTGGTVESIGVRLVGGASQVIAEGGFDAAAIRSLAGSNRVPGGGMLVVPEVGPHYDQAAGGSPSTLTFTVDLRDDGGRTDRKTVAVPVMP
ncbi:MAG TPA: hypothetical protein VKE22_13980 [Haliangiales bacterium]|nr:hypothetical protein [Haliangiales bacterium]